MYRSLTHALAEQEIDVEQTYATKQDEPSAQLLRSQSCTELSTKNGDLPNPKRQ